MIRPDGLLHSHLRVLDISARLELVFRHDQEEIFIALSGNSPRCGKSKKYRFKKKMNKCPNCEKDISSLDTICPFCSEPLKLLNLKRHSSKSTISENKKRTFIKKIVGLLKWKAKPHRYVEIKSTAQIDQNWKEGATAFSEYNITKGTPKCDMCNRALAKGEGYLTWSNASTSISGPIGPLMLCEKCSSFVYSEDNFITAQEITWKMPMQQNIIRPGEKTWGEIFNEELKKANADSIALIAIKKGLTYEKAKENARRLGNLWWKNPANAFKKLDEIK